MSPRRRRILWGAAVALLVVALLPLLALIDSVPPPPLDWTQPIVLPDGRTAPLEEVATRAATPDPVPPSSDQSGEGEGWGDGGDLDYDGFVEFMDPGNRDRNDLWNLAQWRLLHGETEEALALLRAIPEEHPRWGRVQRAIGWDVYTRQMGRPDLGIGFVNRSLMDSPFEGNVWQDAYRTYWRSLVD